MKIIPYEASYRDDLMFMVQEARNALGRVPHLNEDLLAIPQYYLSSGDRFWLAADAQRVVGGIGCNRYGPDTAKLHRFYVKCTMKRQGIGTRLLETAEQVLREAGYRFVVVHLGGKGYEESGQFYPKRGYKEFGTDLLRKEL